MKTTLALLATGSLVVIAIVNVKDYLDDRKAQQLALEESRRSSIAFEEDRKRMEEEARKQERWMKEQTIESAKDTDAMLERLDGKVRGR